MGLIRATAGRGDDPRTPGARDRLPPPGRLPARESVLLRLPRPGARSCASTPGSPESPRRGCGARVDALLEWVGLARGRGRAPADLLEGHAAAPRDRAGARARPERRLPRRAHERPRPDRPRGDPRPDPAAARRGQDGLHEHRTSCSTSRCSAIASRSSCGARIRYEGVIDDLLAGGEPEVDVVLAGLSPEAALELEERFGAPLRGHRRARSSCASRRRS